METNVKQIKLYLVGIVAFVVFSIFLNSRASAQCIVSSSNGYTVHLSVVPEEVIPSTTNCAWGYNFNYKLSYNITFTGSNIPSSLYTLQGNVLASGHSGNFFDLPNEGGNGTVVSTGNSYTNKTNCNSVTVASLNPSIEIQIQGPGLSYRTISCPIVTLPVQLVSFSGTTIEAGIMLNWATASEENNDYFVIERSSDAQSWETLGIVKGAGHSSIRTNYTYTDAQPKNGINYYRLKQTDVDGTWSYSKIILVEEKGKNIETTIYPNPASGSNVWLSISTSSQEAIEAEIFNTMGQKLRSYEIPSGSAMINYEIALPEAGNMFMISIIQGNQVIGRHQVLVR